MSAPPAPDLITASLAALAAARSAPDLAIRGLYAALARTSIDGLEENVRKLRLNLGQIERELLRLGAPKQMKESQ